MTFFARPNLDNIQFRQISGSTLILQGTTQFKIAEYTADNSSNYTNRSLVDKEYVDILVSGSTSGATPLTLFNQYTGDTEIRLIGIENNINYLSGITDTKLDTVTFTGYTADTEIRFQNIEEVTDIALTGATNGLTKVGSHDVELGGALTKDTVIGGATFDLSLGTAGSKLDLLNVHTSGNIGITSDNNLVMSLSGGTIATSDLQGLRYNANYIGSFVEHSLVSKLYVDTIATGLHPHDTVLVATTTGITLSGAQTIDGVALIGGERVLVKDQTSGATNGIYVVNSGGTWTRATDFDGLPEGEVVNGDLVPVLSGDTNANTIWVLTTPDPITVGITELDFTLFSKLLGVSAGDGIAIAPHLSTQQISVDLAGNSGLEFTSGDLRIDLVDNSGLQLLSTGLTVNPSIAGNALDWNVGVINANIADINTQLGGVLSGVTNGLTEYTTGVVGLGGEINFGELVDNTIVIGSWDIDNSPYIAMYSAGTDTFFSAGINTPNVNFYAQPSDISMNRVGYGSIVIASGDTQISRSGSGAVKIFTNTGFALQYADDESTYISGNYLGRLTKLNQIPSIDYVTGYTQSQITGVTLSYNNGLTQTGQVVSLGGTLVENTNLNLNENSLIYSNIIKAFDSGIGFDASVVSIIEDSDGKYVMGGNFTTYSGLTGHGRIIRLNKDGSVDSTFVKGTGFNNGNVGSIIEDIDGKYVIGGAFTQYTGGTHNRIIRLNKDASVDTTFVKGTAFNNTINSIIEDIDGKYVIVGQFTTYTGATHNRIIRLNKDGSVDNTFNTGNGFNQAVYSITEDSDGKYVIGGQFTQYSGITVQNYIIRLNKDGSIDNTFVKGTGFNNIVRSIIEDIDGKYVIGGGFFTYSGITGQNRIIRLNKDGSVDNTFVKGTGFNDTVFSITEDSDGKYVIVGQFTTYTGATHNRIIRLNKDGSVDNTFVTGFNVATAVFLFLSIEDSDGKYVIGGQFTEYSGETHNYIVRLNKDGSINTDENFDFLLYSDNTVNYISNVSSNFTNRSLVDKEYVDNLNKIESKIIVTGSSTLTIDNPLVILVNHVTTGVTVTLPSASTDGRVFKIKDVSGNANINTIEIYGNGNDIDGASSAIIDTDYGALEMIFDSTLSEWFVISFNN